MSVDVDTQPQLADTELAPPEMQTSPTDGALADTLGDNLGEGGGDAVQMILPPKPGTGPKVTDTFEPLDQILGDQG